MSKETLKMPVTAKDEPKAEQPKPPVRRQSRAEAIKRARAVRQDSDLQNHSRLHVNPAILNDPEMGQANFHFRWVSDKPGRLEQMQARGYEFVTDDDAQGERQGTHVKQVVGTSKEGAGVAGHLMRIPLEIYEEDQRTKARKLDTVDDAIKNGEALSTEGIGAGTAHGYVPKEGNSTTASHKAPEAYTP